MENKDYIKNIERKIRELAKDYEKKGYIVYINPKQTQLPNFLKGYEPDLIAKSDKENVLIEVKTRNDRFELKKFEKIAQEIDNRKNWRFEIVFTNTKEKFLNEKYQNTLNEISINNRIIEIKKLITINSYEAAFLLSWATIEAVIRQKLHDEIIGLSNKTTLSVIKKMFSLGMLNQRDYRELQKANAIRNTLIHGFEQPIDKIIILNILQLIDNLTGKNREIELLDWLSAVDLENYEEIYSLYRAVVDKGNYGLFGITERENKIILKADHLEETLEFSDEDELSSFSDLIEEEYMEDMDPEGWYGFHRAMEKDD